VALVAGSSGMRWSMACGASHPQQRCRKQVWKEVHRGLMRGCVQLAGAAMSVWLFGPMAEDAVHHVCVTGRPLQQQASRALGPVGAQQEGWDRAVGDVKRGESW
jgi:hypothetical protein